MENKLQDLYLKYDFPGIDKFYKIAKQNKLNVTYKQIKDFIENQKVSQLHKKAPKRTNHPITTPNKHLEYQMDILDMKKFYKTNSNIKYILVMIDIFSRRGIGIPIKNKSADDTVLAIKKAFEYLGTPKIVASDNGLEFQGAVAKYFDELGIVHKTNEVGDHNGIVDRFVQTVKNKLYKYFSHGGNTKWVDKIQKISDNYNNTPHTALENNTPNDANKHESDTRNIHYRRVLRQSKKEKLKVGDIVRILNKKSTFSRGYERKYSDTTYKIISKRGFNYILNNDESYRMHELLKIPKEDLQEIPDVAAQAKQDYQTEKYLKREGIEQSNILPEISLEAPRKRKKYKTELEKLLI
jgi:hypothetical protein